CSATLFPLSLHDALPICRRDGQPSDRHWSSRESAMFPKPVGAGSFCLHCRFPFARLRLISNAPRLSSTCILPSRRFSFTVAPARSEEHTSELQSREKLVC